MLIPACASSSPAFHMIYSAYKLKKQGDNTQPWRTPFPIWNQTLVPCTVLTVASWPAYRFLRGQVWWSGILISLRIVCSLMLPLTFLVLHKIILPFSPISFSAYYFLSTHLSPPSPSTATPLGSSEHQVFPGPLYLLLPLQGMIFHLPS